MTGDGKRKQKLVLGCERGCAYKRIIKKIKFEETGTSSHKTRICAKANFTSVSS
jgi:hypothetical protein